MTHEFVTQPIRRNAVTTARFLVAEEPGPHGSRLRHAGSQAFRGADLLTKRKSRIGVSHSSFIRA